MINLDLYIIPTVMIICGIVGYCIKHIDALDAMSNEYIPAILTLLGAILAVISTVATGNAVTLDVIAMGMVSGVASTGVHQLITLLIEKISNTKND